MLLIMSNDDVKEALIGLNVKKLGDRFKILEETRKFKRTDEYNPFEETTKTMKQSYNQELYSWSAHLVEAET